MSDQTLEFAISGMTCAGCVSRVERVLASVPGVEHASVNLATERASVRFSATSQPQPNALVQATEKAGYHATLLVRGASLDMSETKNRELSELRRSLLWSTAFTIPLFLIAMLPMLWTPWMDQMMRWLSMTGWNWIMLLLAVPVQFWIGRRFYISGWKSLIALSPDMNALVSIGTTSAFLYSLCVTLRPDWFPEESRHVYFEASAVVITLVLLGRYLESRARGKASASMRSLLQLQPKIARVVRDGTIVDLKIEELAIGDVIEVRPGETLPADGVVLTGTTFVNESMVTGEPMPVSKSAGDTVVGGTTNGNGSIQFRTQAVGKDSTIARIVSFVENAQATKPAIQNVADRVVAYFVPAVLLIALLTAIVWWSVDPEHGLEKSLIHAVSVLIIACPCAMGLAVPTSIMVGTGKGAQLGFLFRTSQALQSLQEVDTVALDKSGTITEGKPRLIELTLLADVDRSQLLGKLARVQEKSEHPLAKSIVEAAKQAGVKSLAFVMEFVAVPGLGVHAKLSDRSIVDIGSSQYMLQLGIDVQSESAKWEHHTLRGESVFFASIDHVLVAVLAVADTIKGSSSEAINELISMGKRIVMVTGDSEQTALSIGGKLGVHSGDVYAGQTPRAKAEVITGLQSRGRTVAFVGDGINDAPALSIANVGVAIGTGTDLAIETADVILMSGDLLALPQAISLSRSVMTNIKQNLAWAFGYNILLIPMAAGLFHPWTNWNLSPVLAALAMSLSSFFVVANSLRLKSWTIRR